jgi:hypothetical protein
MRWLALAVVLSACTSTGHPSASPTIRTSTPVAQPTTSPNAACSPPAVRTFVASFLEAYDAGSPDIVDRFIASGGQFQWFAQPDRPFPSTSGDARNRATLASYLAKRHRLGDHYTLSTLKVGDQIDSSGNRGFSIQMVLRRPGRPPRQYGGKGALTCDSGRLAVWLIYAGPPAR